ncbi:MAG: TRAP transporter large permease [Synergistaceae bacterium]|jgi:C4-dicarboxylate transporter DctM subunit|nr:TRAP transporter large permease [Synergistaceae bacterium]
MTIILFGCFVLFVFLGMPIAICLGLSSVGAILYNNIQLVIVPNIMYSGTGKYSLLAIPFFVLAGVIMEKAGISQRLIKFASVMVGHIFGGLAIVTVLVSCFFAAISGSGPATVAALGPVLIPAMFNAGYEKDWAAALVANGGNIGIIIPPSVVFVIYGVLAEVSIGRLFTAGIIPGILFGAALIFCSLFSLRNETKLKTLSRATARERWKAFKDAFWGLMTPVIILGGIYGGFVTPTEAAGIAAVYGLLVGVFIYREIKLKDLWRLFVDAGISSAVIMFVIANASVFAWILTTSQLAARIAQNLIGLTNSSVLMLLLINLILLLAGCFLDTGSAMYIFIPILLPVVRHFGIDPLHFGVIATVNLAIGMATPPVGLDLFVACNISGVGLKEISYQTLRFVFSSLISLLLITYLPFLSTWLPEAVRVK